MKELVKPMLPDLTSYKVLCFFCIPTPVEFMMMCHHAQVVPYWSRGQVAVEMKAKDNMKKREAQFSKSCKYNSFFCI